VGFPLYHWHVSPKLLTNHLPKVEEVVAYIWIIAEPSVAVIGVSLATLRPLLRVLRRTTPQSTAPIDPNIPPTIGAIQRKKPKDDLSGISLDDLEKQDMCEENGPQSDEGQGGPSRQESKDIGMEEDAISLVNDRQRIEAGSER
jgi:hypothetical protein